MLVQFKMKNVFPLKKKRFLIWQQSALIKSTVEPDWYRYQGKIPAGSSYLWRQCQRKVQFRVGTTAFSADCFPIFEQCWWRSWVRTQKCSKPFSFEENKGNSEFEIVQILRDEEYQYGFEYNSEKIVMEWLYRKSLKTNRKVTIFERTMQK